MAIELMVDSTHTQVYSTSEGVWHMEVWVYRFSRFLLTKGVRF